MFACFALAFAIALGRAVTEGGLRWPALAGVAAGLAIATKETSVLVLPASLAACALAWWSMGSARHALAPATGPPLKAVLVGLGLCATVAVLFYSSFLTHPAAILEPFRAAPTYVARGVDPADHVHPWHFYLGILAWSSSGGLRWTEGLVLGLAAAGAAMAWFRRDPAPILMRRSSATSPPTPRSSWRSSPPSRTRPPGTSCPSTPRRLSPPASASRRRPGQRPPAGSTP